VGEKLAIAPDGRTIAFVAATATNGVLYVRRLDELTPRLLPGTENARAPFFSPDGRWIGFIARGRLRKVPVDGGPVVELTDGSVTPDSTGALWTPDGDILFSRTNDTVFTGAALLRVPAAGGAVSVVGRRDPADLGEVAGPILAPDGRTVVAIWVTSRIRAGSVTPLCLVDPDGRVTRLDIGAVRPLGFVDDHLIFLRSDGTIMAVPLDLRARAFTGPPVALLESVSSPALSSSGSLLYSPGQPASGCQAHVGSWPRSSRAPRASASSPRPRGYGPHGPGRSCPAPCRSRTRLPTARSRPRPDGAGSVPPRCARARGGAPRARARPPHRAVARRPGAQP
jgi:serine/threonine-protein kinase